ncbi:MAG: hypothetical protein MUO27_01145 [Sedimentisphaerales bacterium]|nr:hypothetical protein [Sedimentisphaerales bacterium]
METWMETWSVLGPILGLVGGFLAGWLVSTERARGEIYARRLEVYQKLNGLASDLLFTSIKADVDPTTYREKMLKSRLDLSEFIASNAMLVSNEVGSAAFPMFEATLTPCIDDLRTAFNAVVTAMARDLRLQTIDMSTRVLLPFESRKQVT